MLQEFERALVFRENLETVAERLKQKARQQQEEQRQIIDHDLKFAQLIQTALTEPNETGMYAIGKAYIRNFRKKYLPNGDINGYLLEKAVAELEKELEVDGDVSNNEGT